MLHAKVDFIGCGALNWDVFFKVEKLSSINFRNLKPLPGREISLPRKNFLEFLNFLEKRAEYVFSCGGGSAANTLYALSKWGFKTAFFGAVGEDSFGETIFKELEKVNLNTEYILKKGETSLAIILLDENKDRFIVVSPGTSENYLKTPPLKSINTLLHLSSFASKNGQNFQKELLKNSGLKISFDPGEIYTSLGKNFLLPWLGLTEYLFITEKELKRLAMSFEDLFELGVKMIFLKKGEKGAEVISKEENIEAPAIKVKAVVDNTGAGDYFNAGILAGIKLGLKIQEVLKLGIYSAGISLRNYGRKGCLTKEEFQNYINLLK